MALRRAAGLLARRAAPLRQLSLSAAAAAAKPQPLSEEAPPGYGDKLEVDGKVLHPSLLNKDVASAEYAVRGELYLKAEELRRQGKEIIFTNVGNPHALGQPPISFFREVISLVAAGSALVDNPRAADLFAPDAIARAKHILKDIIPGGVGAYSDSRGALGFRQEIADYIKRRDGVEDVDPDSIFMTDGASVAVRLGLNTLIRGKRDGILVPIPQYPLYSASIELYGGSLVGYELDESNNWGLSMTKLKESVEAHRARGGHVRGMVFINPGNPTGTCLSIAQLEELAKFAYDEKIVLMADEVYQENVYQDERPFHSMRKTLAGMGEPYASGVELLSFHTVSKGTAGECGLRGGYVEAKNIHPGAMEEMYKMCSINLSPNVTGQVAMSLMVNPPKPGDASYETFNAERDGTLQSLRRRAQYMTDAFNSLEGVTCVFTEGAMYSFPQIRLPAKAMAAAKAAGKAPDVFYCLALLEATGISTVPGSGFGQEDGTFHFRTTILPMEDDMPRICDLLKDFHAKFMAKYK